MVTLQKRICTTSRRDLVPVLVPFEHFLTTLISVGFFFSNEYHHRARTQPVRSDRKHVISLFSGTVKTSQISAEFLHHIGEAVVSNLRPETEQFRVCTLQAYKRRWDLFLPAAS
jgi:hypothetical protein